MPMKHRTRTIFVGNIGFDMYRKYITNEWVVRVTDDNKRVESRCYYTTDQDDAEETMKEMVREEELKNAKAQDN